MAHLLVVESWVGSMSRLLPRAIGEGGHEFTFVTRDLHHYLRGAGSDGPHPLLAARNIITADTNDMDELLPHLERLHAVLAFDGVVSSCDYYLRPWPGSPTGWACPARPSKPSRPPAART